MEEKVISVFADHFEKDAGQLSAATRLEEDLFCQSLDLFGILAMLEATMGSAPGQAAAMGMKTVGEFIAFYHA